VTAGGPHQGTPRPRRRIYRPSGALAALAVFVFVFTQAGCGWRESSGGGVRNVVVVNSPASGVVRRVLVREGERLGAGDAVVEIAIPQESGAAPRPTPEDPQRRAAVGYTAAQGQIEAARSEVVRAQVEVQRLSPLVAAGQASQGELDGAQAVYQRAQQRLQEAQAAAGRAEGDLVSARTRPPVTQAEAPPPERLVVARASAGGTVTAVAAREGQRVEVGHPLATLREGDN